MQQEARLHQTNNAINGTEVDTNGENLNNSTENRNTPECDNESTLVDIPTNSENAVSTNALTATTRSFSTDMQDILKDIFSTSG